MNNVKREASMHFIYKDGTYEIINDLATHGKFKTSMEQ
jgi:hypothetical protein